MADWDGLRGELESSFEPPPLSTLRERRRHRQQRRAIAGTFALVLVGTASGLAVLGESGKRGGDQPAPVAIGAPIDRVVNGDRLAPPADYVDHVVTDVDFVSPTTGWSIGLRCVGDTCDVATWRTDDGGRTWGAPTTVAKAVPRVSYHEQDPAGGAVRSLRMVDEKEGFAFGPDLYVTHDGARTWQRVPQPSRVSSVQVHDGVAWVFQRGCADAVDCDAVLRQGRVGKGFTLSEVEIPPTGGAPGLLRRADARNGYLITWDAPSGPAAELRTTADGGRTWSDAVNPCPDATAQSLSAGAGRPLWVVCTTGADEEKRTSAKQVHLSTDDGRTWRRATDPPAPGVVTDLVALSAAKAYLTTQVPARLYVTSDGGATWQPAAGAAQAGYGYGNVDVVDAGHAWAMGDAGVLWRTTDGVRWERLALPPSAPRPAATPSAPVTPSVTPSVTPVVTTPPTPGVEWTGLSFVDANTGWALGSRCAAGTCRAVLRRTADGGRTWLPGGDPKVSWVADDEPSAVGIKVESVVFADARNGWLFGSGFYATHDGGASWKKLTGGYTYDVVPRGDTVWAVSYEGCASTPCGPTVSRAKLGSDAFEDTTGFEAGLPRGQFVASDARRAYYLGAQALVTTADGGATWAEGALPCGDVSDRAASAYGPTTIWAVCGGTTLAVSSDAGATWRTSRLGGTGGTVGELRVLSDTYAWRTGANRGVLVTRDGGRTWRGAEGVPGKATALTFADPAHGWVISGNTVYRTTDGVTWARVTAP